MSARPGSAPASWIGHLTPDPVTSLVTPGTGITSALIGGTLEMPSICVLSRMNQEECRRTILFYRSEVFYL